MQNFEAIIATGTSEETHDAAVLINTSSQTVQAFVDKYGAYELARDVKLFDVPKGIYKVSGYITSEEVVAQDVKQMIPQKELLL